jgi:porphobilinogen synthase
MPLLVQQTPHVPSSAASLPAVALADVPREAQEICQLGIRAVKLFAGSLRKDLRATEATRPDGLMARAIEEIKALAPGLRVITEACLCPYTEAGHCALLKADGRVDLAETYAVLREAAVLQAQAGADVVGPAGMVDGSVEEVRSALDSAGFGDVAVMPHLTFDSLLYGPYRHAMRAQPRNGDRRAFQIDPSQPHQAIDQARRFVAEGADAILLEPALPFVDVLVALRSAVRCPIGAFSASGEHRILTNGAGDGFPSEEDVILEFLASLKRAGADLAFSYAAKRLASRLSSD